ncbi:hypothetical protein DBR47_24010 [Paucibacter sp. KBW04]|uniref:DUF642 domain-containing protein n=1 Tax=Paucibacter sp. KBW04 TaxID=2153361 RepID=UPI000F56DE95|nr:DUF642 domain-containing protein [Paucibacter sp. KBW04]RQO53512.1 hypothetical protein DBR47_24010 [Paucibacter sp. KBW04]
MKKLLLAALISAPLLVQAGPVNLVQNGSFESNTLANGAWQILSNGQLSQWQVGNSGVEIRNNVAGKAFDGVNYLELDANSNGSIAQVLNTVQGQWYQLTFAYSNRSGVAVNSNGLGWSIGNLSDSAPVLAFNNTGDNVWSQLSVRWQATGSSTLLSFTGQGISDAVGSSLDAVSVTAVPEPESLSLAGLALLALGFASAKRKASRRA